MKQTTLTEKRFFEWHEDNIAVTLRNKGGSYGGERSTRHKLYGIIADHPTPKASTGEISFTLNQRDYKGVIVVVVSEDNRNT